MVFLELTEVFAILLVLAFCLFQIIMPIWNGTQLFPFFRSKAIEIDKQLREVRSDLELSEEEKKLHRLKKLKEKRGTSDAE